MNFSPFHAGLKRILSTALAASFFLTTTPLVLAAPGDINSTNNGQVVQGGTYYNTNGGKTTFVNNGAGGLWVKSGIVVNGLEVDANGATTGNGGYLHFYAPGSVVRIDGVVNASAIMKGPVALGNGGTVQVDAAFYYQKGQIYANGGNGGVVSINTGNAVFAPGSEIKALGLNGAGGRVSVNAPGVVDVQQGAFITTNGHVIGGFDTNLISIEGGLVNIDGILSANGTHDLACIGSRGGTIRLVSTGGAGNTCVDCVISSVSSGVVNNADVMFSAGEKVLVLQAIDNLVNTQDGSIHIGGNGYVLANGSDGYYANNNNYSADPLRRAGDGGTILMTAAQNVVNDGFVHANGGNGANANNPINGGNGGTVAISAIGDIINTCAITANGGNGGNNLNNVHLVDANNQNDTYIFDNDGVAGYSGNLGNVDTTVADASGNDGAQGGDGGLISMNYMWEMKNSGRIEAKGGNGGYGANAYAEDNATNLVAKGSAFARADAIAGNGGDGGDGGLMVYSGPTNPYGNGSVNVNGGNGGDGGNAKALANANGVKHAGAEANAYGGKGGNGGEAGTVVAPNPVTFDTDQNYTATSGDNGWGGKATATANGGTDPHVTWFGHAKANAVTHDNGVATANANARGMDAARSNANAVTGNDGEAYANADSHGSWYTWANANAESGDRGLSRGNAVADATGYWHNAPAIGSYANANSKTGVDGAAISNADAKSAKTNAEATANADYTTTGKAWSDASAAGKTTTIANSTAQGVNNTNAGVNTALTANANVDTTTGVGPAAKTNRAVQQTQDNELLAHNENLILASKGGGHTTLSAKINDATVRTVQKQSGGANADVYGNGANYTNLVVANVPMNDNDIELDNTGNVGPMNNLNNMDVINIGKVTNNVAWNTNDSISINATGTIENNGSLTANDSVVLASGFVSVENNGTIASGGAGNSHGGAVIVKAKDDIVNTASISANGEDAGGMVAMYASDNIYNTGTIEANATSNNANAHRTGGQIVAKAKGDNLNYGTVQANDNGNGGTGQGGWVQVQAGNVAANMPGATMQANGATQGGRVILAAGGNDRGGLDDAIINAAFGGANKVLGFSDTALTPAVTTLQTTVDLKQGESALNFGDIRTKDRSNTGNDGKIYMAGNQQFGLGHNSTLNDVAVDVTGILGAAKPSEALQTAMLHIQDNGGQAYMVTGNVTGSDGVTRTAVESVVCDAAPNNNEPDVNPNDPTRQGSQFPNDFTLPNPTTPPGNPNPNIPFIIGQPAEPTPTLYKDIIAYAQPNMFLAQGYTPVTQEILNNAAEELNRQLARGITWEETYRLTRIYLAESGVDPSAARMLLDQIGDKRLNSDPNVKKVLERIAGEGEDLLVDDKTNNDQLIVGDPDNTGNTGETLDQGEKPMVMMVQPQDEQGENPGTQGSKKKIRGYW